MIKFYQNRELSEKLEVALSKWKRWSREFLPPDPLGGMQSGFARQYSIDDALNVFLGGYLVSGLKFSIPAARQILKDLQAWLQSHHFFYYFDHINGKTSPSNGSGLSYRIYILPEEERFRESLQFRYIIKQMLRSEPVSVAGHSERQERYLEERLRSARTSSGGEWTEFEKTLLGARVLYVSNLHQTFLNALSRPSISSSGRGRK